VRGVSVSSSIIKTLMEREWVRVLGHREVPGRPALFGTTRTFLDDFGLKELADLPSLAELRDLAAIESDLFEVLPAPETAHDAAIPAAPVGVEPGDEAAVEDRSEAARNALPGAAERSNEGHAGAPGDAPDGHRTLEDHAGSPD